MQSPCQSGTLPARMGERAAQESQYRDQLCRARLIGIECFEALRKPNSHEVSTKGLRKMLAVR